MRRAARSFGVVDPALLAARLRGFGQPAEYDMPLEIVRNAVVFHARGLINTRAIQNNLDWVWPYWIERQFDPEDVSFLPRSANFSHINLTHRNWTAVGLPDLAVYSLVDPRGLVMPLHDGWAVDAWVVPGNGLRLVPSQLTSVRQELDVSRQAVRTGSTAGDLGLLAEAVMVFVGNEPWLELNYAATSGVAADLVVALRPYNTEGIQFIDTIDALPDDAGWLVNRSQELRFGGRPDRMVHSYYAEGDVFHRLHETRHGHVACPVGMASAAACFAVPAGGRRVATVRIPLGREARREHGSVWRTTSWRTARETVARFILPDERHQFLCDAAVNTLLHLSAGKVYPGPYTYRRFWFRDASLMLEALLQLGAIERVRAHLDTFPRLQKHDGYFESQEGEWDSNGEVLWVFGRFAALTGEPLSASWCRALEKGARWLARKRLPETGRPQDGLLPAGFSAEHFGPNDHYYWDVFWAIGGLRGAAAALENSGHRAAAAQARELADKFARSVERSINEHAVPRGRGAVPASPFRRMDSGAIGVLVADYPLQLYPSGDDRVGRTVDHFLRHHFVNGGFFQDMTHSGVNIYLTLAVAQSLLRAGDPRWQPIIRHVAADASPTGQWPEAIHPMTGGGCIGDGQHGWAAAEWVRWVRNAFVREEAGALVLGSGLLPEWLDARRPLGIRGMATPWGAVTVEFEPVGEVGWTVRVAGSWREPAPRMTIALPGRKPVPLPEDEREMIVETAAP
ncbi:MAG TPA: hypothetical protein VGD81_13340 [Opitutaceae bacterium]